MEQETCSSQGKSHQFVVEYQIVSPEDSHAGIYIYIHKQTYTHATAINEKRGLELEGEWGSVYCRVWRGERKGKNIIIIL